MTTEARANSERVRHFRDIIWVAKKLNLFWIKIFWIWIFWSTIQGFLIW